MTAAASKGTQSLSRDAYTGKVTTVEVYGPPDLIGLERIMLTAQGDLQRLLSAFLGKPIVIEPQRVSNTPRGNGASPCTPILQSRIVHLKCCNRVVCVATSSVTITSPECESLLLDENYALGQVFRRLRVFPTFTLLDVGAQYVDGKRELRRTYRLETEGIVCDILEVFPDRDMFSLGEAWLYEDIETQVRGAVVAQE